MSSNPCSHNLADCNATEQRKAPYQDWASLKEISGFTAFSQNVSQSSAKI